ncbi:hypothetical protein HFP15_16620 [Amycolatopsis sp. K13G38]|uniref:Calcineurin-like phosphoesterase domain-containing protein n=1 Tax=Amycolatopsis acididurans TaxID=2724524 RepID=A0ABX1J831_9PSEU|nr:hypothetical protein [Amycolatopsis acididurans]NKQ54505.1 hypothetical protein [Amycolatopsis acididurans]
MSPLHSIVQLSDLHMLAEGALLYDKIDTAANLTAALASVETLGGDIEAVVLTGDLAPIPTTTAR